MKIYYLFYLPGAQITEEALQFQLCCKVITELSIVMHYITALLTNVMSRLWSRGLRVLCCLQVTSCCSQSPNVKQSSAITVQPAILFYLQGHSSAIFTLNGFLKCSLA